MITEQSDSFRQGYQDFLDDMHYNIRYIPMSQEWRDWIEGWKYAQLQNWFFFGEY